MPSNYKKWIVAEARRKMKKRAVAYLGGNCIVCGYNKCVDALDFHHRNPEEKDFKISSGSYRQWQKVKVELDKCDLLCSNCHRERHAEERSDKLREVEKLARLEVNTKPIRVKRECEVCGTLFERTPSAVKYSPTKTCGNTCRIKAAEVAEWPLDEDLSNWVWEEPVALVALSLGVSGVAVKKRCKRRGISTPPRGYWSKKRSTKMVVKESSNLS